MDKTEKIVLGSVCGFTVLTCVFLAVYFFGSISADKESQHITESKEQAHSSESRAGVAEHHVSIEPGPPVKVPSVEDPIEADLANELVYRLPTKAVTESDWELCQNDLNKLNDLLSSVAKSKTLSGERNVDHGYIMNSGFRSGTVGLHYPDCRVSINFRTDIANVFFFDGPKMQLRIDTTSIWASQDGKPDIMIDDEFQDLFDRSEVMNKQDVQRFCELCRTILIALDPDGSVQ